MENKSLTSQPLLQAKNLILHVPIYRPGERRLLANPLRFLSDFYIGRSRRGIITILNDISFTLNPGERLGLIGANGAGKSTLLRVLARIYKPTEGELVVNGDAKGMFDISLGMNHEATGLENIYIRGLHMGLSLRKIKELVPEIVEFSELEDHMEKPFNTYSSGMMIRLAFSVSTMIEPDILLLDEWIGAADKHFNKKIQNRMDSLVEKSRGLVLATHGEELMRGLCTHGLVLSKGKVVYYGTLDDALAFYAQDQLILHAENAG